MLRLIMATSLALVNAFVAGLEPPPQLRVAEWADEFRMVTKPSPEPGPWVTDRVPYMREPMNRMSPDDPCEIVALMKGSQGAATEGGLNVVGATMHQWPRDIMFVQPTIDAAKTFSVQRIERLFEGTPVLRDLVGRKGETANLLLKRYGAGDSLFLAGANSAVALRSNPVPMLILDEVDAYPSDLAGEGNPIDIAIERTANFRGRKILIISTPVLKGGNIHTWYLAGDQRAYVLPCPLCGREQELVFGADRVKEGRPGGLRWPKGQPDQVQYQCEHCGDRWNEFRKVELLVRGAWVPKAPGHGAAIKLHSYGLNSLIYPYGWPGHGWVNLAAQWESAQEKPERKRTFINLKLGLPYADPTEATTDAQALLTRCEMYGPDLPAAVCLLTLGADVQKDRIECEVLGWGAGEENWSIEYHVFPGETARPESECWRKLDALLATTWASETGLELGIKAACIDASYQQDLVRKYAGARRGRNVWAVIGRDGQDRPTWPTKAMKAKPGRPAPAYVIGVDALKETVYARLRIKEPGPGYCHFPVGRTLDQFEMLTAETRKPDYAGPIPTYRWQKKVAGSRNEYLDIRGYQHACVQGLVFQSAYRLDDEARRWKAMAEARAKAPMDGPRPAGAGFRRAPAMQADDPYLG